MDDILVYGSNQQEHNDRLHATLKRLQDAGVTLNKNKCEFNKTELRFLGHHIGPAGLGADQSRVSAVVNMEAPHDISGIRRFLGMANQLGRFVPNLTQLTHPLRELLRSDRSWVWGPAQAQAFAKVKDALVKTPVLALYDTDRETKVTADASSHGLGAVLSQKWPDGWRPVAFASRSLTDTESRYATIEKEALATTWACEKFQDYLIGKEFLIESDHKPLIPLLGSYDLDQLPPRVQRFRMRLMRFSYHMTHVPGSELHTADALSRSPHSKPTQSDQQLERESTAFVRTIMTNFPASDQRLAQIRQHQVEDATCSMLKKYCVIGWPQKYEVQGLLKNYWPYQAQLNVQDDLLLYGSRIVIPESLRGDILDKLHAGHQGITK